MNDGSIKLTTYIDIKSKRIFGVSLFGLLLLCALLTGFDLGHWLTAHLREDVKQNHEADEDQTDDKDGFGLDGEACSVLGKVL